MREYYIEEYKKNNYRMIVRDNGKPIDILVQFNPNDDEIEKIILFSYHAKRTELQFDDFNIDRFLFCN